MLLTGCDFASKVSDSLKTQSKNVQDFARENPALDIVTNNSIKTTGLLLYSLGVTIGLFRKKKLADDRGDAIIDIINDPNNTASLETISAGKTTATVVKSL